MPNMRMYELIPKRHKISPHHTLVAVSQAAVRPGQSAAEQIAARPLSSERSEKAPSGSLQQNPSTPRQRRSDLTQASILPE